MKNLSLKFKISAVAGIVFIITLIVLIFSSFSGSKAIISKEINNRFISQSKDLSGYVDDWVGSKKYEINLAAAMIKENYNDREKMLFAMKNISDSGKHDSIYFATVNGEVFFSDEKQTTNNIDPRGRPWYKLASKSDDVIITKPYRGVRDNVLKVSFAKAVKVNGQLIGVVSSDIGLAVMTDVIRGKKYGERGYAFVMSTDGIMCMHPNKDFQMKNVNAIDPSLSDSVNLIAKNESGYFNFTLKGNGRIFYYHKLKNVNWVAAIVFDKSEIEAPLHQLMREVIITAVIFLVAGLLILVFSIRKMFRPMDNLILRLDDIVSGDGDLTQTLASERSDELGTVAKLFNRFIGDIRAILAEVQTSSESVASSSIQLAANVQSITEGLTTQSNETNELAAAVEEMNITISQIAENATDTSLQANKTMDKAKGGQESVDETVSTMRAIAEKVKESAQVMVQLGASTQEIGDIINVINDIADQTNLLALNAAIEAARAGEHGRGFAVVADEVRKLAERTQNATSEITSMISNLQTESSKAVSNIESGVHEVQKGTEVADQAGLRLSEIIEYNTITTDMINQIATAAEEQSTTTNEISSSVTEINSVTEENSLQVSIINEASQHLSEIAESLKAKVSVFKV